MLQLCFTSPLMLHSILTGIHTNYAVPVVLVRNVASDGRGDIARCICKYKTILILKDSSSIAQIYI